MHAMNPFAKRLQEARLSAKLSQRELGIRIGFEPSSASSRMNHYERGRHVPDYTIVKLIAEVLEVPPWYFFCDSDEEAIRLIKLARLSEHQVSKIDKLLDELVD
ncbi:XRE family transcriptional regulator [Pseudidiomarina gelatinasegens]|uniref:XRE family transcriptional regulator n=2 Tax=Pseudidiomarina gelatinasegens TaxID=2487740 RepID=A0A443YXW7_9GAMM|nr:XRE family transcriptional regulator [Pseudidiomarina gelatinasegens]